MEKHKISLMEAYMIETLRRHGISNEELLAAVRSGDISEWEKINDRYDFKDLLKLAEKDSAAFQSILYDGYGVKFVTYQGLQNLLAIRFKKEKDRDYELIENGLDGLQLDEQEQIQLEEMLSVNWVISKNENGESLRIELRG
ncbi:hypothetical protein D8M04_07330 [Oceanobacillus piezotolerans]|uniref:Uncharacterized protein n=1 Tax=Oceanobacillus piezotolerans TaxID=2448030 RepID=A0A498DBQ2_9BACI|nr:hypothetical protein [Oceanobacillus piezotolerans]RLL46998.1 hypothetical protein D8M04_07330 [Oceanobacillus piezotolerans]